MTSTPLNAEDERVLAALALALVDKPRATLQELAQAIGISKATLYRFSRTREELVDRLMAHGAHLMNRSLEEAELDKAPTVDALRRFIEGQLRHSELAAFMIYYWKPDTLQDARAAATWTDYFSVLDEFFVRGQREGIFRIEIGAAVLSESLISLLSGLMDAERRGRIARASLPGMIETLFLAGAQSPAGR
ncbi:MAG: TetR family transcriptional regulator [Curvibacter lanceolatus]|jgi:TetR/AcrR family transcriptional repressor of mexCD-oprJ operon|uniref:TetR/AcrR family transcriptional regulator n=1 Tax=Curvibacter lanceolatus TaxID=86182 RepID=UPI0003658722|nr:antitoxin Xre-like helix-turn-helix domain-containing protein [Curvibacter lanceolatus]MBV5291663.1 TetR family transcriptional regulator [Curvibacter lanceolatus]